MNCYFTSDTFRFLKELKKNNNRDWFLANKHRYEESVRRPFLRLIADFAPHLKKITTRLVADPKPQGGSLFRIYRDVRFSEDKSPYKTHSGAHFSHAKNARDVHSPGYYLHLEPGQCFAAAGLWHPDSRTIGQVRSAILNQPDSWKKVKSKLKIEGDKLKRPPKGFSADHPLIEDLKHKDYITSVLLPDELMLSPKLLQTFTAACRKMSPLGQFLSKAIGLPW